MTEAELAWLAGILEGEGSFMVAKSRYKERVYRYARITVQMSDADVIERVHKLTQTKGGIFTAAATGLGNIPLHRVWVSGQAAYELMEKLRPWMGKRRQARIDEVMAIHAAGRQSPSAQRAQLKEAAQRRWADTTPAERQVAMRPVNEARWNYR